MEGGLFNPGFLGGNFLWWIGQVMDDSEWRGNLPNSKPQSKKDTPGWGYRYKVRIIGLHDKDEEVLKTEDLPWGSGNVSNHCRWWSGKRMDHTWNTSG